MCCWGYGELSKESDGRARLRVVMVGKELAVSVPQSRPGREVDLKQKSCQIPRNCSANSTLWQVSGLDHRGSCKDQAFSCWHPPRLRGGVAGQDEVAAGLCPLVGANGLLAQDWFILSLGQRGNLTQQHVQENDVGNWISPSHRHSKAEKEEEEERGLQGDGPRRRSMESKAPISKLLWGMDFPVVTSAPHCHRTVHAHVNPPVPVLYPLRHGTASPPPCMPLVCEARGEHGAAVTCCLLHPSQQPSLPVSVTLLWGMYGN